VWWIVICLALASTEGLVRAQEDQGLPPLAPATEQEGSLPAETVELLSPEPAIETKDGGRADVQEEGSPLEPGQGEAGAPMAEREPGAPRVQVIEVKGVQRIEPDVIFLRIRTKEGDPLSRRTIREDIHTIMETGYFRQVAVEAFPAPGGVKIVYVVEERPTIREIRYEGVKQLEEEDLQEVVTIRTNTFLNIGAIKEDLEKIRKLYANEGYFRANVDYEAEPRENNQVNVVFKIQENEEIKVRRVLFLGNTQFSDKKLRRILQTKKKDLLSFITSAGAYKEDVLKDDVTRLTLWYLDHGYLQFSAKPPLTLSTENGMYVFFVVEEGRQYTVRSLEWEHATEQEQVILAGMRTLMPGEIFSRQKLQEDITAMTDYYADQGYAFAEIVPLYYPDESDLTVDVIYRVQKGDKYYVGDIRIAGNTKTRDKVIRREMAVIEGDLYSGSMLRFSKSEVERLGYFDAVNITTEPGAEPNLLDVVISVKEGQTGTLSGGAGFSSTDQFILMANVTQSNLFGRGQVLSLNAEIGGTRQNFSLSFTEPWLFDIPLSAGFDVFNTERVYQDFTRRSMGGALRLGYELRQYVRANVMYKYEDVEVKDVSSLASITLQAEEGMSTVSSVTFSVVHNTLDNPMFPMKGFLNIGTAEFAGTIFGGNTDFLKFQVDTGVYIPIIWDTTVHLRARAGWGEGLGGDRLPVFERYFVGGISTVRGYDVRSLGPEVDDVLIGGNKELIFNVEYIFPIAPSLKLRGLFFFDAGNAFSEDESIKFQNLRFSAGGGIRWFSPMGPLTFVLGFPLDRQEGEDPSAVQFSIGTPF
jgi:outer membrane protein insertion porin family